MNSLSEQNLLNGAKTFDLSVLETIYDQYSPGIYRYAIRLLGDDCLAEDCVADTFSRFLKALHAGQGPQEHLQAYLYRIAHNWITDYYRRQAPPPVELEEDIQASEADLPENRADFHLQQQQVRLALRSLSPDQRQVITLRFVEGWDNDEVAKTLEKPINAIKALQHRALITLRKLLLQGEEERG